MATSDVTSAVSAAQASVKDVSFDELLDDTLGLSFKSLRSIWLLFKNPASYFSAAKSPFWHNSFSPSFRIYAGLMALSTGMRFLYRDENSPMVKLYSQLFQQVKDKPPLNVDPEMIDPTAMAITTLKWYILIAPFAMIASYVLLGLIYWGYGEKLNAVVRIRYVFASMIPASVAGFLMIFPIFYFPEALTGPMSAFSMLAMFGLIFLTSYRGAFQAVPTQGGRIGRATALSALIMLFMIISVVISLLVGIAFAFKEAFGTGIS